MQYDLQDFDAVMNPRPQISDVIAKFGEADKVVEEDLAPFGVKQNGKVYYFGRLGFITLVNGQDIFWVLIE